MTDPSATSRHLAELTQKKSKLYGWLAAVPELVDDEEALPVALKHVSGIIEFAVWQELSPDPGRVEACLKTLAKGLAPLGPADALCAWRQAVEAGLPSRSGCRMIMERYAEWLGEIPESSRDTVAKGFLAIAPFTSELGKNLDELLKTIAGLSPGADAERAMATLQAYSETDADILLGTARVVCALLQNGCPALVTELEEIVTLDVMMESHDACRLLPELGKLVGEVASLGEGLVETVSKTVVSTARENISSAYATTVALRRLVGKLPPETAAACLRAIEEVLDAAGTRTIGFCTRKLPRLYTRRGIEACDAFVAAAVAVAREQGTTSALWFLERRTAAARDMLK